MGMFDYVRFEAPCAKCGTSLIGWQSKSGDCELETLEPWQVHWMYTGCNKCGLWNEYKVVLTAPAPFRLEPRHRMGMTPFKQETEHGKEGSTSKGKASPDEEDDHQSDR